MVYIDKDTNDLSFKVIGCAYEVHKELGAGLLESVYEACLCYELSKLNIAYERQKVLPVLYKDEKIDCGYRIDILVENKIIIELKTVENLLPIHTAQLMTYLRLSNIHLGLILNFHNINLQSGIRRFVL